MRAWRLIFPVVLVSSAAGWAYGFIGPEGCKGCHPEAYQAWKLSKHARAKQGLSPTQQQDARCVTCHSPNESDPEQKTAGISCETCHGGGQYYASSYVMKDAELARLVGLIDPSEKGCRNCHDASSPSLQPFDFVEKLKLIDHWSAERQRRAEKAKPPAPEPKKKK